MSLQQNVTIVTSSGVDLFQKLKKVYLEDVVELTKS